MRQALVHGSYVNEHAEEDSAGNERLEFLGDALLDFVVAEELYRCLPESNEGDLTALRANLVCGPTLARVAASLNLGEYLLLGRGEEAGGGRSRLSNLASALEAVLGAVLLDQGYDVARRAILNIMGPDIQTVVADGVQKDPKSLLQELVQTQGGPPPVYQVVRSAGPEHRPAFEVEVHVGDVVVGRGAGPRKADAEREAAGDALRRLQQRD